MEKNTKYEAKNVLAFELEWNMHDFVPRIDETLNRSPAQRKNIQKIKFFGTIAY